MISSWVIEIQWQGTGGRVEVEVAITSVLGLSDSTSEPSVQIQGPKSTGTM